MICTSDKLFLDFPFLSWCEKNELALRKVRLARQTFFVQVYNFEIELLLFFRVFRRILPSQVLPLFPGQATLEALNIPCRWRNKIALSSDARTLLKRSKCFIMSLRNANRKESPAIFGYMSPLDAPGSLLRSGIE